MAQPTIKTSFASGEWAPKLRSRVDIQKYHSGAALMRNFYVDFAGGGASTRQGTKYINQCKAAGARIIPFQPSTSLSYALEFGQNYIRFLSNGAPIVETAVTGGTGAAGSTFTIANSYAVGDWVLANNWGGMTNVNGNYFIVAAGTTGAAVNVTDLNGNAVVFTGAYVSGGQLQRVYTIPSPYNTSDLFPNAVTGNPGIKWVQDVTSLIITHPSYNVTILTIISATNWTLTNANFGPHLPAPAAPTIASTSASGGGWNYSYLITAVDNNGQESTPSTAGGISNISYIGTVPLTNDITWTAVSGAASYNVYKALPSLTTAIPTGSLYGFIGNVTGTAMLDPYPGITPDFSQTPPIIQDPFLGSGVQSVNLTGNANYTTVPGVTIGAAPSGGITATAAASLGVTGTPTISSGSVQFLPGDSLTFPLGVVLIVATVDGRGAILTFHPITWPGASPGSITGAGAAVPSNPVVALSTSSVSGVLVPGSAPSANLTWNIASLSVASPGAGYTSAPAVTFSSGAATATTTLTGAGGGNPGVPGFIQQRLAFAAQSQAVQSFNFSQPGGFFNFNISNPSQPDDAISGSIISEELNDIRNLIPVPTGILALTGKGAWLINGGGGISTQVPITPSNVTAQPQAFNGANDLRPIKINMDVLYGTNKGNYVRDLSYNLYAQIFTGSDISVLSNHLFFGFSLVDWCWAEEPFKTMWAVRSDGQLLSLGYVKEQELIGWAHHDTSGQFTSICSVIETVAGGNIVDAVYTIVQRVINGNVVSYMERMADRYFPYGYEDSWSVDCALQTVPALAGNVLGLAGFGVSLNISASSGAGVTFTFSASVGMTAGNIGNVIRAGGGIATITGVTSGAICTCTITKPIVASNPYTGVPFPNTTNWTFWIPTNTVTGLTQLIGQTVVGVADGAAVGPFVVSATGSVALGVLATKVTLGLAYLPQLQALPLDLGEPTVQGKRKKIVGLTLRVADTLGLSVGKTFSTLVSMKDFTLGNVPTTSSGVSVVNGLVNGDGRTILDQAWDTAGNYCIQQNLPYPATILGVMPEVVVGDTR